MNRRSCMKGFSRPIWAVMGVVVLLLGHAVVSVAQSPASRSFAWFAELVSVDQAGGAITLAAPITAPVAAYVDRFTAGDRVVIVWTQYDGEADAVMYVSSAEAFDVRSGYIVQAEYVSGDASAGTITFRAPVDAGVISTLTAAPGTPIRVTSPMKQPAPVTPVVSIALNESPNRRPESEPEAEPDPEPQPVEIVADPSGPTPEVGGQWIFETSLQGNPVSFQCEITQAEAQLTGTCTSQFLGEAILAGRLVGSAIEVTLAASFNGNDLEFAYTGGVDAAGMQMQGDVVVAGFGAEAPFQGRKTP